MKKLLTFQTKVCDQIADFKKKCFYCYCYYAAGADASCWTLHSMGKGSSDSIRGVI